MAGLRKATELIAIGNPCLVPFIKGKDNEVRKFSQ